MKDHFILFILLGIIFLLFIGTGEAGFANKGRGGKEKIKDEENEFLSLLQLPVGRIKGEVSEDKSYVSYLGIRYGKYGKRFEPSEMEENLNRDNKEGEAYDATKFGDMCPQVNRLMQKTKKQVMFFIHGGNYVQGSGNDPYVEGKEMARKGLILVTINYRVGLFGFFAHSQLTKENPQVPTNFGLLDMVVALKWVKKHISFFGGDPDDVTVFGESAGANAIQWLMAHKGHATSPLFTSAILQSAPASSYPHDLAEAESMGCHENTLECLRAIPFDDFISRVWTRRTFSLTVTPLPYAPIRISSPHADSKSFPTHPSVLGINGDAKSHRIIIGTTKNEWMLFLFISHILMAPSDEWMHKSIDLVFSSPHYQNSNFSNLSKRLDRLYPRENYESGVERVSAIYTDNVFYCPSRGYARKLVEQGATVYFYMFSHVAEHGHKPLKAYHAAELPFVFQKRTPSFFGGLVKLFPTDFTHEELDLSNQIIALWSQLSKEDKLKLNNGTTWPQFTKDGKNFLELSVPLQSHGQLPFDEEICQFWDEVAPGPQKAVIFDLMEHEPLLLKVANEYTLLALTSVAKNGHTVLVSFLTLIGAFLFRKCFLAGAPSSINKKEKDDIDVKYP